MSAARLLFGLANIFLGSGVYLIVGNWAARIDSE
jgi:hypothetical protein